MNEERKRLSVVLRFCGKRQLKLIDHATSLAIPFRYIQAKGANSNAFGVRSPVIQASPESTVLPTWQRYHPPRHKAVEHYAWASKA
jgi:hypothetical protein